MKIAFRVDASIEIGTGHVMRCLTLAEELRARGTEIAFVCREHPGNLCDLISAKGFEIFRLSFEKGSANKNGFQSPGTAHASWLGVDQYTDVRQTIHALQKYASWDWIVIDHYALDYGWESAIRDIVHNIMVIDDLADRKHVCDILLDQNYFKEPAKRYTGLLPQNCKTLFGPEYALLRGEFRKARHFTHMRGNGISRILIYFGGTDQNNLTGTALQAFRSDKLKHLLVDAVVGPNNSHLEKLQKQVSERPITRLHIQPEGFTELMLRADLCIGAGGTTVWERLCLHLPSLVITVAENQEGFTEELDKAGYVKWIGVKEKITASDIENNLIKYIQNLKHFKSSNLVDGFGALRVIEMLLPSEKQELRLRKADISDVEQYFLWANEPAIRENSFQQELILWKTHIAQQTKKISMKDTEMWVLQTFRGLPVGQFRFEIRGKEADIDFSLDQIVRGRGWGIELVRLGLEVIKYVCPVTVNGQVKPENQTSSAVFMRLGFEDQPFEAEGAHLSIAILSDRGSWINVWLPKLIISWLNQGHRVLWTHNKEALQQADFCFYLSCSQIVPPEVLKMFSHNLVVHESDLPRGKGWSPLTRQILEGKNKIPVTMIEAEEKVDSGVIYAKEWIEFQGDELINEVRARQAKATIRLCEKFVREYPDIIESAIEQTGEESFYPRRKPEDSRLETDKSIGEQFNLLRVVDNEKYPAFFDLLRQRYVLKIEKKIG